MVRLIVAPTTLKQFIKRINKECRKFVHNAIVKHILILYGLTFLVVLPALCHRMQYSVYFIRSKTSKIGQDILRQKNSARLKEAEAYLEMAKSSKLHSMLTKIGPDRNESSGPDIALAVVTVSRNRHFYDPYEPRYLTQVVAKFLQILHGARAEGMHFSLKMFICNVDFDPASYNEANNLSTVMDIINRFNKTTPPIISTFEKEKQDYTFCINETLRFNPRYSLIVEDDALPNEEFFKVVHHVIEEHLEYRTRRGDHEKVNETVLYTKLYHPERLLGYINLEADRLTELFGVGFVLGTITVLLYKGIFLSNLKLNRFQDCLVYSAFVFYFMLLVICIGRPHILELRRIFSPTFYSFMGAPECCTPAMLFPAKGAKLVVKYLDSVKCSKGYGKDTALERFRQTSRDFTAYLVQPNLVSHIGMYSSLRNAILDPFIV